MKEMAKNDDGFKKLQWQLAEQERQAIKVGARSEALNYVKSFLDMNFLLIAQDIKEKKLYRYEIDPETGESFQWAAYCTKKWHIGQTTMDGRLGLLNQYGQEFVHALQGMNLPRRSVRLMLDAPPDMQAKLLELENAPEDEREA